MRQGLGMARIPVPVPRSATPQGGSVLFGGRLARIVGFDGGTVKLRFADGADAGVELAEYVLQARAVRPTRGPGVAAALAIPWQPTGQRAHQVRKMLDGYTAGRRAALRALADRSD